MHAYEVRFVRNPGQQNWVAGQPGAVYQVEAKNEREAFKKGLNNFLPGERAAQWVRLADVVEVRQLS